MDDRAKVCKMIKGVIFDLDGVLVSTDNLHFMAWKRLAEEIGIRDYTIEDNIQQRGISRMDSLEILLRKCDVAYTQAEKIKLSDRKNGYYQELLSASKEDILLPGAKETLKFLKKKKIKIAIGSSSRNAPQIIKKVKIEPYIDACVCGADIVHSKPDPEVFLKACKKIDVEEKQCLVIEDSAAGIVAAKQAGMKSLGVGYDFENLKAHYVEKNLASIDNWEQILEQ